VVEKNGEPIQGYGLPRRLSSAPSNPQFEKEAKFWWGTIKPEAGEPALTWEQLKTLMDAQYYPQNMKRAKE